VKVVLSLCLLINKKEIREGFLKEHFAPSIIYDYENIFLSHASDQDIKNPNKHARKRKSNEIFLHQHLCVSKLTTHHVPKLTQYVPNLTNLTGYPNVPKIEQSIIISSVNSSGSLKGC
jgi:hypothetical protein